MKPVAGLKIDLALICSSKICPIGPIGLRAYPDNPWGVIIIRCSCADFLDFIRSSNHGQPAHPGGVAYLRRSMGSHRRPLAPTQEHPPLRRRTAAHPRPGMSGGHPVRPAHRLSVEGSERNEISVSYTHLTLP